MVDEGTITKIYGLGKELLDKKSEEVVVPKIDKIQQAYVFMDAKECQTVHTGEFNANVSLEAPSSIKYSGSGKQVN